MLVQISRTNLVFLFQLYTFFLSLVRKEKMLSTIKNRQHVWFTSCSQVDSGSNCFSLQLKRAWSQTSWLGLHPSVMAVLFTLMNCTKEKNKRNSAWVAVLLVLLLGLRVGRQKNATSGLALHLILHSYIFVFPCSKHFLRITNLVLSKSQPTWICNLA